MRVDDAAVDRDRSGGLTGNAANARAARSTVIDRQCARTVFLLPDRQAVAARDSNTLMGGKSRAVAEYQINIARTGKTVVVHYFLCYRIPTAQQSAG